MALNNIFGTSTSIRKLEELAKKKEEGAKLEEWTWIEGYKGTNPDMTCTGYQYELGKQFDMPEDANIKVCDSGFHFCKELKNVFDYYRIGNGNRFFKVKALVRAKDVANGGSNDNPYEYLIGRSDKFVAKSIIFYYELSPEEVFAGNVTVKNWSTEEKLLAIQTSIENVMKERERSALIGLGYSQAFTEWIVQNGKFDVAYAVGSQKDLSMDMKVLTILQDKGKKLDLLNNRFVINTSAFNNNPVYAAQLKAYTDQVIQQTIYNGTTPWHKRFQVD